MARCPQHGPRLYVVMEAAGGGDLCAHVLSSRGGGTTRGLPEGRARALAAQLVSAVKHMHARGVVHRDLKMENIMLDSTKQFIKIVDFGLSNVWHASGALRTPCGSLEYAAPELFVDGRRYGPEVDLWSIGVIVYGMVTGSLPFTDAEKEGQSRPQLRAAIARGFTRKQRTALACVSSECKTFIQHLLEPNVELRNEDRGSRKAPLDKKTWNEDENTSSCRSRGQSQSRVSELCGQTKIDVITQIKADPFGPIAGIYNIKTHLHQMHAVAGTDMLWSTNTVEPAPVTPPEYRAKTEQEATTSNRRFITTPSPSRASKSPNRRMSTVPLKPPDPKLCMVGPRPNGTVVKKSLISENTREVSRPNLDEGKVVEKQKTCNEPKKYQTNQSPRRGSLSHYVSKKSIAVYDSGDCTLSSRLPRINEHSNTDLSDTKIKSRGFSRSPSVRKYNIQSERINSYTNSGGEFKRSQFYRKAGDGLPRQVLRRSYLIKINI
ncbi:unnamed protein product [Parnassius apollo]|uniref:(apollo) hypothetical protein n=1 Tax=Parnassius apollo TaxID=110799 RepID=A0A8S3YD91_PARAO|nr:unnamed protein product [Parnassius apollo]